MSCRMNQAASETDGTDRQAAFLLFALELLFYMPAASFSAYIALYYQNQGMSIAEIGILTAIGPVISMILQPLWGSFADHSGKYISSLRISLIGSVLGMLVYPFAHGMIGLVLCCAFYFIFYSAFSPIAETVILNIATARRISFSRIRTGGSIGFCLMICFAGWYFTDHSLASIFPVTAAIHLLTLLLTFPLSRIIPEKSKNEESPTHNAPFFHGIGSALKDRRFLLILLYILCFQSVFSLYWSFLSVNAKAIGISLTGIGMLNLIGAVSEIPILLLEEKICRKFSAVQILMFSAAVMAGRIFLTLAGNAEGFIAAQILNGAATILPYYCAIMYINDHLPHEIHATAQSLFYMVQGGISSALGDGLGGIAMQAFGMRQVYIAEAIFLIAVAICTGAAGVRKAEKS